MLIAQESRVQVELKLSKDRIRHAIEVSCDDWKGERFLLDGEEIQLEDV